MMQREEFIKGMSNFSEFSTDEQDIDIDNEAIMKMLREFNGSKNSCMFAMEELAELSKEFSKLARGEGNWNDILQELADVYITVINALVSNCLIDEDPANRKISSTELRHAVNVKLSAKNKQLFGGSN